MCNAYEIYKTYKEVEGIIKNKKYRVMSEELFYKKTTPEKLNTLNHIAGMFSTVYSNINLRIYIECGFHHFRTFDFNKFFREIILREYISRDGRAKRTIKEDVSRIESDLLYINRPLELYVKEMFGHQRMILNDYIHNNIGNTIVSYCIQKGLYTPSDEEWQYMSVIDGNYSLCMSNAKMYSHTIDKWRSDMKKHTAPLLSNKDNNKSKLTETNELLVDGVPIKEKKKKQEDDLKRRLDE